MDDQNHLDYSTEGTAPVFDSQPNSGVAPVVNTPEPEPILLPAPGPGPSKPPVSKRMKILLGLFSAVILVSGLITSLLLVKQKQDQRSKAADNMCNVAGYNCTSWEQGWLDARKPENIDTRPTQEEKTNANTGPQETIRNAGDPNSVNLSQKAADDARAKGGDIINSSTPQNPTQPTTQTTTTPTNTTGKPSTEYKANSSGNALLIPDTQGGQVIDNACNLTKYAADSANKCDTRQGWIDGWFKARSDQKYKDPRTALDLKPTGEFTDLAHDMDLNTPGQQIGKIVFDQKSGTLGTSEIYTATTNITPCTETDSAKNNECWEKKLKEIGATPAITITPVGKIVNGKIVYNQPVSGTATSTKPISQSWYDLYNQKCVGSAPNTDPTKVSCCGAGNIQCGGPGSGVDGFCVIGGNSVNKGCNNYIADAGLNIKTGGFCAKNTTDVNGNKICSTYTNGSLISQELSGFVKVTNDSCIESLGSDVLINAYVCDGMKYSDNPKGCNYSTPTESKYGTGAKLCFDNIKSSGCGVVQIDADTQTKHYSINLFDQSKCNVPGQPTQPTTPTGGGGDNPPTTTTTFSGPTPTPTTPNPQLACYQLQIFRGGTQIQPWQINQGDALIFRGFASVSGGATVSKMRFTVTVGGVAQTPVDVNATLVGGLYQADYNYTITQNTSYSVTTFPL